MLQSPLLHFPGFGIHPCNLLESRVVVTTYNHHCSAPFSRALVGWHHQSLLGRRSRHCYGINYTQNRAGANPPHFAATPDSAAATGRVIVNTAPPPGAEAASMFPPCSRST